MSSETSPPPAVQPDAPKPAAFGQQVLDETKALKLLLAELVNELDKRGVIEREASAGLLRRAAEKPTAARHTQSHGSVARRKRGGSRRRAERHQGNVAGTRGDGCGGGLCGGRVGPEDDSQGLTLRRAIGNARTHN